MRLRLQTITLSLLLVSCHFAFGQSSFKRAGDYYALQVGNELVTSYIFTEVSEFYEGKAWVNKGNLYGYIDTLGRSVTDFVDADVDRFVDGFAAVSRDTQDGDYGFVYHVGQEICTLKYSRVKSFENGFAAVQSDSNWTLIDTSGSEMMIPVFDYPPKVVSERFVIVVKASKWGVIDSENSEQYPFIYDLITADGLAYLANKKVYLGLL